MAKTATTVQITLDAETAPLLLELASKAAVAGHQAKAFGRLYEQVERAHALIVPPQPKPPAREA